MPELSRPSDISHDDVIEMILSLRVDALAPMAKASPVAADLFPVSWTDLPP
jgi:hypothetical protein